MVIAIPPGNISPAGERGITVGNDGYFRQFPILLEPGGGQQQADRAGMAAGTEQDIAPYGQRFQPPVVSLVAAEDAQSALRQEKMTPPFEQLHFSGPGIGK